MKNNIKEIITTSSLLLLTILLLNPFHFWMPDMIVMCLLVVVLVIFGIFASFILREKDFDERDSSHRAIAGRNAFLSGATILIIVIVVQEFNHNLDVWLVIAFIGMVVTKIVTRVWADKNL